MFSFLSCFLLVLFAVFALSTSEQHQYATMELVTADSSKSEIRPNKDTLNVLRTGCLAKRKVAIVSFIGQARFGKSTILSRLTKTKDLFPTSNSVDSKTQGARILLRDFRNLEVECPSDPNEPALLLVDTQGFFSETSQIDALMSQLIFQISYKIVFVHMGKPGKDIFPNFFGKVIGDMNRLSKENGTSTLKYPEIILALNDVKLKESENGRHVYNLSPEEMKSFFFKLHLTELDNPNDNQDIYKDNEMIWRITNYTPPKNVIYFSPPRDDGNYSDIGKLDDALLNKLYVSQIELLSKYIKDTDGKEKANVFFGGESLADYLESLPHKINNETVFPSPRYQDGIIISGFNNATDAYDNALNYAGQEPLNQTTVKAFLERAKREKDEKLASIKMFQTESKYHYQERKFKEYTEKRNNKFRNDNGIKERNLCYEHIKHLEDNITDAANKSSPIKLHQKQSLLDTEFKDFKDYEIFKECRENASKRMDETFERYRGWYYRNYAGSISTVLLCIFCVNMCIRALSRVLPVSISQFYLSDLSMHLLLIAIIATYPGIDNAFPSFLIRIKEGVFFEISQLVYNLFWLWKIMAFVTAMGFLLWAFVLLKKLVRIILSEGVSFHEKEITSIERLDDVDSTSELEEIVQDVMLGCNNRYHYCLRYAPRVFRGAKQDNTVVCVGGLSEGQSKFVRYLESKKWVYMLKNYGSFFTCVFYRDETSDAIDKNNNLLWV